MARVPRRRIHLTLVVDVVDRNRGGADPHNMAVGRPSMRRRLTSSPLCLWPTSPTARRTAPVLWEGASPTRPPQLSIENGARHHAGRSVGRSGARARAAPLSDIPTTRRRLDSAGRSATANRRPRSRPCAPRFSWQGIAIMDDGALAQISEAWARSMPRLQSGGNRGRLRRGAAGVSNRAQITRCASHSSEYA